MDRNERIAAAFHRLFRTYQRSDRGDAEALIRERMEQAAAYFEAVSIYEIGDIEAAVTAMCNGSAHGFNPAYQPPAPVVAAECRRQMGLRLRSEELDRMHRPQLPPPDIQRTPEAQARVRELMQTTVRGLGGDPDEEAKALDAAAKARWAKVNQHFAPPQDEREMAARLGYVVGDADGEADAA